MPEADRGLPSPSPEQGAQQECRQKPALAVRAGGVFFAGRLGHGGRRRSKQGVGEKGRKIGLVNKYTRGRYDNAPVVGQQGTDHG